MDLGQALSNGFIQYNTAKTTQKLAEIATLLERQQVVSEPAPREAARDYQLEGEQSYAMQEKIKVEGKAYLESNLYAWDYAKATEALEKIVATGNPHFSEAYVGLTHCGVGVWIRTISGEWNVKRLYLYKDGVETWDIQI